MLWKFVEVFHECRRILCLKILNPAMYLKNLLACFKEKKKLPADVDMPSGFLHFAYAPIRQSKGANNVLKKVWIVSSRTKWSTSPMTRVIGGQ